jgi:hypothetical protein
MLLGQTSSHEGKKCRACVDWGVEGGHTTNKKLRLTVSVRQEKAKQLTRPVKEGGNDMSKRAAAKVLGVPESTLHMAETRAKPAENARTRGDSVELEINL